MCIIDDGDCVPDKAGPRWTVPETGAGVPARRPTAGGGPPGWFNAHTVVRVTACRAFNVDTDPENVVGVILI